MIQNIASILLHFQFIIPPVIIATLLLKASLYIKFKTNEYRYYNFIYFKTGQIISSKTEEKLSIKIVQNSLSYYVVFLVLLQVFIAVCK